jgi:nondiscriminating aspartyl-tRNA synthetase
MNQSEFSRVRTTDAAAHVGERVRLAGWLHALRRLGGINFLLLRDGWGTFQAVLETPEQVEPLAGCQVESVIEVEGRVAAEPQAPGGLELRECQVRVLVPVSEPMPFAINKREMKTGLDTFLDHATVGLRHPAKRALLRLAAGIMAGFRNVLRGEGFTEIQTPKLVGSATEGGANVFSVDYFGRPAYLAQSPQLYKQIMVGVFERVYEVGPVFRAEPHSTARHTNEYVSLDVEFGFIQDHTTVMTLLNRLLAGILGWLSEHHAHELALLDLTLPTVPAEIPRLHFTAAQQMILDRTGVDVRGEPDLSPQDERWLGEWGQETHGSDWVFVSGYPMVKRPFYTHPDPADPRYSNSFDLIFRGTEIVTGGQRLHLYADYMQALEARGMSPEPFAGYLEAFRHGMPPHGGFAIGLERIVAQLAGLTNLREATLFPRDMERLSP